MSDRTPHDPDWGDMASLWRSQPVAPIDAGRLRREARASTRRLLAVTALETVSLMVVLAVAGRFFLASEAMALREWILLVLLGGVIAFTAWTFYNRRGLLSEGTSGPDGLVRLETARARAALRFWRVNTWVAAGMLIAVVGLALAQHAGLVEPPRTGSWWLVSLIGVPMLLASILIERWRASHLRRRLAALHEMASQLGD